MIDVMSRLNELKLPHRALGQFMQLGFVVRDLESAMRSYTQLLGIGPWIVLTDSARAYRHYYRGQEVNPDVSMAFSYMGDMMIELIQQRDHSPTPYQPFLESGCEGLQHLGFLTPDYDASQRVLAAAGLKSVFDIWVPGGEITAQYYEAPSHLGVMIELLKETPARTAGFAAIKATVDQWNGKDPVRKYPTFLNFASTTNPS